MQRGSKGSLGRELHLVVLQHGMWGCPEDMAYVAQLLQSMSDARKVVVLNSDVNAARLTYDGIDVLGDRLAQLVISFCERMAAGGLRHVTRISFVAYSLGGLIARYAIGKLAGTGFLLSPHAQGSTHIPSAHCGAGLVSSPMQYGPQQWQARQAWATGLPFVSPAKGAPSSHSAGISCPGGSSSHDSSYGQGCQHCRPSNQTTTRNGLTSPRHACSCGLAAGPQSALRRSHHPHLGRFKCPPVRPVNFVTFASPHLGSWQAPTNVYRVAFNAVLPYTLSRTGSQLVMADQFLNDKPLLAVLADPAYAFHAGLAMFQKRILLANTRHDATVPFTTSGITMNNPYESLTGVPINDRYPCIVRPGSDAPRLLPPPGPPSKTSSTVSLTSLSSCHLAVAAAKPAGSTSRFSPAGLPTGSQVKHAVRASGAAGDPTKGAQQFSTAATASNSAVPKQPTTSSCMHPTTSLAGAACQALQQTHSALQGSAAAAAVSADAEYVQVLLRCSDSADRCVQVVLGCPGVVRNTGSGANTGAQVKDNDDMGVQQGMVTVVSAADMMAQQVQGQPDITAAPDTDSGTAAAGQAISTSGATGSAESQHTAASMQAPRPWWPWFMPSSMQQMGKAAMKTLLVTQLLGSARWGHVREVPAAPGSLAALLCSGIGMVSGKATLQGRATTACVIPPSPKSSQMTAGAATATSASLYHTTTTILATSAGCNNLSTSPTSPKQGCTPLPPRHSTVALLASPCQGPVPFAPNPFVRSPGKLRSRQSSSAAGSSTATPFAEDVILPHSKQAHSHAQCSVEAAGGLLPCTRDSSAQQPTFISTNSAQSGIISNGTSEAPGHSIFGSSVGGKAGTAEDTCIVRSSDRQASCGPQLLSGVPARSLSAPRSLYQSLMASSTPHLGKSRPALTAVALSALQPGPVRRSLSQMGGNGAPFGYAAPFYGSYSKKHSRQPSRSSSAAGTLFQELSRAHSPAPYARSTSISRSSSYSSLPGGFTAGLWTLQRPSSGRLQGEVFIALLPLLVLLWCCMLLWLLALSGHHYAVRVMGLRRDRSWPILWPSRTATPRDVPDVQDQRSTDSRDGSARLLASVWSPRATQGVLHQQQDDSQVGAGNMSSGTLLPSTADGAPSCIEVDADCRHASCNIQDAAQPSSSVPSHPPAAAHQYGSPIRAAMNATAQAALLVPGAPTAILAPRPTLSGGPASTVTMTSDEVRSARTPTTGTPRQAGSRRFQAAASSFWPSSHVVPVYLLALHWLHSLMGTLMQLLLHAWGRVGISCWRGLEELWTELLQGWAADNPALSDIPMPGGTTATSHHATNPTTPTGSTAGSRPTQRPASSWYSKRVVSVLRGVLLSSWGRRGSSQAAPVGPVPARSSDAKKQHAITPAGYSSTVKPDGSQDVNSSMSAAKPPSGLTLTQATAAGPASEACTASQSQLAEISKQAQLQQAMCEQLNQLSWTKVAVDTQHYHAHACIVVRSAARFAASHGHVVEYAVRLMRDLT